MTILKKLIPVINRLDRKLSTAYIKLNSWVFYNINGGYKCTECGAKHLRYRTGNAVGTVPFTASKPVDPLYGVVPNNTRMLLHWYGKDGVVCPLCAQKAVIEIFENYRAGNTEFVMVGKCDFSGETNVPVIDIIWDNSNSKGINIRFGREWWNGFSASQYAFEMAISNCEMESMMTTYIDGVPYYNAGENIMHKSKQTYREFVKKNFT